MKNSVYLVLASLFFILCSIAESQSIKVLSIDAQSYPVIKAEITTKDASGSFFRDYPDPQNNFTLFDGGNQRTIITDSCPNEAAKVSVILVLDISLSMDSLISYNPPGPKRMDVEKSIAYSLIKALPVGQCESAVLAFDELVESIFNFSFVPSEYKKNIIDSLLGSKLFKPRDGTDFMSALIQDDINRRNPPNPGALLVAKNARHKPIIIFITDGNHDSNIRPLNKNEIIDKAREVDATINCILLGNPHPETLADLTEIAGSTNSTGNIYILNNSETLGKRIEFITEEISEKYFSTPCIFQWETDCSGGNIDLSLNIPSSNSANTNFKYSIPENIKPPKPVITRRGDTMFSNYSTGNQWYYENTIITGATENNFVPLLNGNYSVKIVDGYECESDFSVNFIFYSQVITTEPLDDNELCEKATFDVIFTASGEFNTDNVFFVQMSNDNFQTFRNDIGDLKGTSSGTINAELPKSLPAGNKWRIRVCSSSPYIEGSDNGSDITVSASPSYNLSISRGYGNRKHYEVNEDIIFAQSNNNIIYESAEWNFGADANPSEYSGLEPPAVSYSSLGLKNITLDITYSSKCNYKGSAKSDVSIIGCEVKIDSNACVDSVKYSNDTMWCQGSQIWILPTGSLNYGKAWNKTFIIETGGNLNIGGAWDCIFYLKPGSSLNITGNDTRQSACVKSPGASGRVPDSISNKNIICQALTFNYTTAPKEGVDYMIAHGYLDVPDINRNDISIAISPNPASERLFITVAQTPPSVQTILSVHPIIEIYNVLGETVISQTLTGSQSLTHSVDVSALPPGMYHISLNAGGQMVTRQFAVVR